MRVSPVILALLCFLCSTVEVEAQVAPKYALLIGVTKYQHARMNESSLKFPEADASSVKELLEASGYKVDILLGSQATKAAVDKALKKAGNQGTDGGVVLVGLFGHGVQYGKLAYFCPYDTRMRIVKYSDGSTATDDSGKPRLGADPASLVSMSNILAPLNTCGASNKILLADCCRNDPTRARGRSTPFGSSLKIDDLPKGTAAFFACSKNEQAFEHDDWGHGAFTYAFLKHANSLAKLGTVTSGRLSDDMSLTISEEVKAKTHGQSKQTMYALTSGTRVNLLLKPLASLDVPTAKTANAKTDKGATSARSRKVITDSLGIELVRIPAGTFLMGSPESEKDRGEDEQQHEVRISRDFYLGKHEVTQGQWKSLMGTEPWKGERYVKEGANYPATNISWNDAVEFCKRLSSKEGVEYRLPTEAEWEYSCRGGSRTAFSFGDNSADLSRHAWWGGLIGEGNCKKEQYAHQVGLKPINGLGLHDMHGNVWEWCQDKYDSKYYGNSAMVDPQGSDKGSNRVFRGGSWNNSPRYCRSASRYGISPDSRNGDLGFRVLRSSIK